MPRTASTRRLLTVLLAAGAYAACGLLAVSLDAPAKGWAILATSAAGLAGLVLLAQAQRRTTWLTALGVLVPLSLLQVFPDWFLAARLGTITFPDNGGVRIDDAIPLAMAGLWALPLLITVVLARGRLWAGAPIAAGLFFATELMAPSIGLWQPAAGLREVAGVAVYVVPAEAGLGAATVYAVRAAGRAGLATRVVAAAAVSVFYTGALALSSLLIDGAAL